MKHSRTLRRYSGALAATMVAMPLIAACGDGNGNGGDNGSEEEGGSIGVSAINLSLPFFIEMQEASEGIADDYGVDITWQSADGSIEDQINTIENFVAQGHDVILIDPVNADALDDVINRATEAGVDVVTMGNKVEADANHNTLYPDHDNWVEMARTLGTHLEGEGQVLLLIGSVGNYVSDTRQEAFETTMAEEFPDIEIITQATDFDSSQASSVTQTVVTENPDLDAIASISDGLTLSAITVVEQAGMDDVVFVSNDGSEETYEYVEDGTILANVLTGSYRVGAWNGAVGARLAQGSDLPNDLFMPTHFIASDEVAEDLSEEGFELDHITPEEAPDVATDYLNEFGADLSDDDMTVE